MLRTKTKNRKIEAVSLTTHSSPQLRQILPQSKDVQIVSNFDNEIELVEIKEKAGRLPGCYVNFNFKPVSPPQSGSVFENDKESSSSDEEQIDPALTIHEDFSDFENEKMPRWRLCYEMTGKIIKFKGAPPSSTLNH